jgi:WD40 repeat protein
MRHDLPVNCLAFAPDNLHLAAGSGELDGGRGTVGVWRIFTGQEFYTTDRPKTADRVFAQEHYGLVTSVCFSPDGRRVLSASHDETARVWDARTGAALLEFKHESSVYQAAYSPDGRTIVSGGRDHSARVWKVATGKVAVPPLSHGLTVTQTVFSPDGERVLTTTDDGARIWELRTGEPLAPILKLSDPIWKMTISADGRLAVAVSRSGAIRTWDTQRSTEGRPFAVPEERLPALSGADGVFFSADASLALIARGARAQIWNTRGGAAASPVMDNGAPISFAVFSPDRTRVLLASGTRGATKGVTRLWDVTSGNPIGQPLEAAGVVTFATFSADGRYLLTASGTRSPLGRGARLGCGIWSPRHLAAAARRGSHHASFSPDLRHAVTASVDNTAKIWSLNLSARTPRRPPPNRAACRAQRRSHTRLLQPGRTDGGHRQLRPHRGALGRDHRRSHLCPPAPRLDQ